MLNGTMSPARAVIMTGNIDALLDLARAIANPEALTALRAEIAAAGADLQAKADAADAALAAAKEKEAAVATRESDFADALAAHDAALDDLAARTKRVAARETAVASNASLIAAKGDALDADRADFDKRSAAAVAGFQTRENALADAAAKNTAAIAAREGAIDRRTAALDAREKTIVAREAKAKALADAIAKASA